MLQGTESEPATSDAGPSDEALAALIEEHSAAVYRLARPVVGDPALSADITQETFIEVWRHLDSFRGEGSIRSSILRIDPP